jgi:5-methylcytosine-specific restriction endonuclease McrA
MSRCLVLNSDYSFLNITSSFKALCLAFSEKADVVCAYDKKFHSQYLEIPIPAIVVLRHYKDISRKRRNFAASTRNIIIRDGFRCAYCGKTVTFKTGTKDHVIPSNPANPSVKPGKTVMTNLVSACKACNSRKENRTLHECGMKLLFQPRELTNEERLKCIVKTVSSRERNTWLDWLKENNITLW